MERLGRRIKNPGREPLAQGEDPSDAFRKALRQEALRLKVWLSAICSSARDRPSRQTLAWRSRTRYPAAFGIGSKPRSWPVRKDREQWISR